MFLITKKGSSKQIEYLKKLISKTYKINEKIKENISELSRIEISFWIEMFQFLENNNIQKTLGYSSLYEKEMDKFYIIKKKK
ncbi:hypothetical protein [Candidatus Phytoplasma pini]|uniref:Uncharacterized protein n=1 Tax=Candidatus Phytoplasma pini TaxID=267362 RepID=A0A559KJ18_9MOLU|nr:hypothetical protein [Candidatus Phytoplasma pini]TVY12130.1 hypothetical protein MDPP_00342 [Candidatus Phytoplasma pini]